MEAILRLTRELGRGITKEEALSAIIPSGQPELRFKASYKHCFDRMERRGLLHGTAYDSDTGWQVVPSARGLAELAASQGLRPFASAR